jgi:hypothetical protein
VRNNEQDDGGIKKKILTPGTGFEKPEKGDKVEGKSPILHTSFILALQLVAHPLLALAFALILSTRSMSLLSSSSSRSPPSATP